VKPSNVRPGSTKTRSASPRKRLFWKVGTCNCALSHKGRPTLGGSSVPRFGPHPPPGFLKLNFDGASGGNPGPAGFGAVLQNHLGKIIHILDGFLGETTNNVAELTSLLRGLRIAAHHQHHRLIIEGDSLVIIKLISKILHGIPPWRISPSWRLSGILEDFGDLTNSNLTLIPSHVKREANKVADHLANIGIEAKEDLLHWQAQVSEETDISRRCRDLACRDFLAPDGVPRSHGETAGGALDLDLNAKGRHPQASIDDWGRPL